MEILDRIIAALDDVKSNISVSKRRVGVKIDVAAGFLCLATNARPAFLYDCGAISIDKALEIANKLSVNIAELNDIVVVEFAQDIIFAKLHLLLKHLREGHVTFVDIGNRDPKVISVLGHADYLLACCEDWKVQTSNFSWQSSILSIGDIQSYSGPTLIGLIAGISGCILYTT